MRRLDGKIAIITGAGQGLGEATAIKAAAEGAKVVVVDINQDNVNKIAEKIDSAGNNSLGISCDISNFDSVTAMVEKTVAKFGRVDILINNAGITADAMSWKMTPEQWNKVINVNLTGTFYCCQAVIPYMKQQNYGKIVNVSSVSAYGNIGQINYTASKAGLLGLTKTLAKELGRFNINVNVTLPGFTITPMLETIPDSVVEEKLKRIALGRAGKPEEQANVICFLASDEASYVTGVEILVCGGSVIV